MEFWRTIRSPTVERGRTDAQSVKSQSRKVVIWDLICLFTLVRSPFNCQIQIKNMHYSIKRGRNETRNYCIFCLCMRLMCIKIFTCALMRMDPHMHIIRMNRMAIPNSLQLLCQLINKPTFWFFINQPSFISYKDVLRCRRRFILFECLEHFIRMVTIFF